MYKINVPKLCRLHTAKHNHISIHKNPPDISNYSNYIWLNISRGIKIQLHPDFWLTELVKHNSTGCNWTKATKSLAYMWRMRKCAFVTSSQMREIVELILVLVWGGRGTHSSLSQLQFVFSSWTTILFGLCISFAYICFQPRRPSAH